MPRAPPDQGDLYTAPDSNLCRLAITSIVATNSVPTVGFEPTTFGLEDQRSIR
jgi:hypothetical protein